MSDDSRVTLDLTSPSDAYRNLVSLVIPRPIAWVSTRSVDGVDNLAPHSFFTVAGDDPPMIVFTSMKEKDTLRNVKATGEFVVCGATVRLRSEVNVTGTGYPPGMSEFDEAHVQREPSQTVTPPRVADSPYALECRLVDTHPAGRATLVVGQVVCMAVKASVIVDGRIDARLLDPISRMGGNLWADLGQTYSIRRIPWSGDAEGSSG